MTYGYIWPNLANRYEPGLSLVPIEIYPDLFSAWIKVLMAALSQDLPDLVRVTM